MYRQIQNKNQRKPALAPKPANDTRWNRRHDETKRANIIMGDVCLTMKQLLGPDGDDYNLLTPEEKETQNIERLMYTDRDKMIMRQFEATSLDAKNFSLFTQEKGSTNAYLLFQVQYVLQRSRCASFEMASGKLCFSYYNIAV